jgi:large subunit ribosomal protein L4
MQLNVVDATGKQVSTIDVDDAVFGIEPNVPVMHQVVVAHQANRRAGTHSTKRRGEVEGSTRKIRSQKGTGRARQGSIRAPHHKGGGIAHGPRPHKYTQKIPKMLKRLAIRSALSAKVRDGELFVVESLTLDAPKTKAIRTLLEGVGITRAPLVVTATPDRTVLLSTRNIAGAAALPATHINTEEILRHHGVLMTVDAVRRVESLWGGDRVTGRRAPVTAAPIEDRAGTASAATPSEAPTIAEQSAPSYSQRTARSEEA